MSPTTKFGFLWTNSFTHFGMSKEQVKIIQPCSQTLSSSCYWGQETERTWELGFIVIFALKRNCHYSVIPQISL